MLRAMSGHRADVWFTRQASRGMKLATANLVGCFVILFAALVVGASPGLGDPEPGQLESSMFAGMAIALFLVLVSTGFAAAASPRPATSRGWLGIPVGIAVSCIGAALTFGGSPGALRTAGIVALLAGPVVAAALGCFGRGSAFAFILATPVALVIPALAYALDVVG
jgi:hypothetical protein